MGTINDGYTAYPKSNSTTTLFNPYMECDLKSTAKRALSRPPLPPGRIVESKIGSKKCGKKDGLSKLSDEEQIVEEEEDETFHANDTYYNGNFNPYNSLDLIRKKKKIEETAGPEYEDLTLYREMAIYNNTKKDCVYTLPNLNCDQPKTEPKFNRMYSLPEPGTRDQCIENSSTIAVIHNTGECTKTPVGQKKQNVLYEKTKVIKTNSLTYSTTRESPSKTRLPIQHPKTTRRNNARINRCFCGLNVIFAFIAVSALVLGVVVLFRQQSIEAQQKANSKQISVEMSTENSMIKAINSLKKATEKLSEITSNLKKFNTTLQKTQVARKVSFNQ